MPSRIVWSAGVSPRQGRHARGASLDFGRGGSARSLQERAQRASFSEAANVPGSAAVSSPRAGTPRHSRQSSVEAITTAASFAQPYKASILYGVRLSCPLLARLSTLVNV